MAIVRSVGALIKTLAYSLSFKRFPFLGMAFYFMRGSGLPWLETKQRWVFLQRELEKPALGHTRPMRLPACREARAASASR